MRFLVRSRGGSPTGFSVSSTGHARRGQVLVVMTIKPNAGVGLHDLMAVSRGPIMLDAKAGLELVRSHLAKYNATVI